MTKAILKIKNDYSWLQTDSETLKTNLWRALRFRDKNYFHSRLYKQKLWDGYNEFYKKESGRFLTGLLPEVQLALEVWDIECQVIDQRDKFEFAHKKIDDQFLNQWGGPITLRDYQVDFTNAIIEHKRGVIFAPTSAGKTEIMIAILKAMPPNTPALILANKKSLCDQNYERMMEWKFENVGRLYDKYKEPNIITVATVQSLHKIDKILPKIKVLVVDEIHNMMSKVPKKNYNKMKSCCVRVAVSATPFKFGGKDKTQKYSVKGYFGTVMTTDSDAAEDGILKTKKMQEKNYLSACNCTFWPITEPQIPHDIYLDAVTNGIAESWYFHKVVTKLVKTFKGRTLILVERLAHGDALQGMIPGALWVRGQDNLETRKYVIEELKKSKKDTVAIATQGIFNAGINVFVHHLINAAGGQAEHQITQRIGRGLRVADDKDVLDYHDFLFKINEYLETHSRKRIRILKAEGHEVTVKENLDF